MRFGWTLPADIAVLTVYRIRVAPAGAGNWSGWSDRARFGTGVDEWDAEWIAPGGPAYETTPAPVPVFRTSFEADARLYIVGGRTYEPRVNLVSKGENATP